MTHAPRAIIADDEPAIAQHLARELRTLWPEIEEAAWNVLSNEARIRMQAARGRYVDAILNDNGYQIVTDAHVGDLIIYRDAAGALPFGKAPSPDFVAQLRSACEEVGPASDAGRTLDTAMLTTLTDWMQKRAR